MQNQAKTKCVYVYIYTYYFYVYTYYLTMYISTKRYALFIVPHLTSFI